VEGGGNLVGVKYACLKVRLKPERDNKIHSRRISSDLALANPSARTAATRRARGMRARRGGIMRAFAESDVRSESDAFTTRSKIARAAPDNRSQFLSRNARPQDLSPAGFLLIAAAAAAATAATAADLSRLNGTRSRILRV